MAVFSGFKNFLMQGQLVVVAVGLSIALAFSVLVQTFTGAIITPLVNAAGGAARTGSASGSTASCSISAR